MRIYWWVGTMVLYLNHNYMMKTYDPWDIFFGNHCMIIVNIIHGIPTMDTMMSFTTATEILATKRTNNATIKMFDYIWLYLTIKDVNNIKIVEGIVALRCHINMDSLENFRFVDALYLYHRCPDFQVYNVPCHYGHKRWAHITSFQCRFNMDTSNSH